MNGNEEIKSKFNIKNNIREIFNNILKENKKENKLSKSLNNFKNEQNINNKTKNNINELNLNVNILNKNINNENIENDKTIIYDDYLENFNNIRDEQNKEENEIKKTKIKNNFSNLQKFGLEINGIKNKYHEESFDMDNIKELVTRNNIDNYDNYNNEDSGHNDSSVCDEMILSNIEQNNLGRFTTNNYINKIGARNNVVLSQQLYKNKYFMRKNNSLDIKIEKSVDPSTCCASCT
jgi:hypothetical protein